jgi:hypothetical protein
MVERSRKLREIRSARLDDSWCLEVMPQLE